MVVVGEEVALMVVEGVVVLIVDVGDDVALSPMMACAKGLTSMSLSTSSVLDEKLEPQRF